MIRYYIPHSSLEPREFSIRNLAKITSKTLSPFSQLINIYIYIYIYINIYMYICIYIYSNYIYIIFRISMLIDPPSFLQEPKISPSAFAGTNWTCVK